MPSSVKEELKEKGGKNKESEKQMRKEIAEQTWKET